MNVLIYCNMQIMYYKMEKYIKNNEHIVLASTNIALLNSQMEKTVGVILDSENTFFAKETFGIIEQFNQIIERAIQISDNYLYEIPLRIEGGLGSRIQDFLYLVDIFYNIVKKYHIRKIYCEEVAGSLASQALLCVAKSLKISVRVYPNSTLRERASFSMCLPFRALKNIYSNICSIKRIREKASKCNKNYQSECYDVGYILLDSRAKYLNGAMRQMSFYDKEVETAIFCYRVDEDKDIELLLNTGKTVKFVEAYGDWGVIIKSASSYLWNKRRIQKELKKVLGINKIMFRRIDVTDEILYLFQRYIGGEKLEDVIYDNMVGEFIKYNRFKLMTGNGDSNFVSNKSFYFHAKKKFSFWGFKDLTITSLLEIPADQMAFERYPFMWKFVFSDPRKRAMQQLENAGWEGDVYVHSDTCNIKKSVQKKRTNEKLTEGSNVLWAPSRTMYGLYSIASFMEDNQVIIKNLDKLSCSLKVKYHFSQDEESIKAIHTVCKGYRVEWIDRKEMIEPHIEWADTVFTTISTVILNAMSQGKFVVCVVDDLEWNYVGDLKNYCYVVSREKIDYQAALYDADFRRQWIKKQDEFMEMMTSTKNDVSIVEVLNNYINNLNESILPREKISAFVGCKCK